MNKKAILGTTVSMILMLTVLFLTGTIASRCAIHQTTKAFNELIELLDELETKEEGTSRVTAIYLNEDTVITGFNENQDKISVFKGEEIIDGKKTGKKTYLVFRRPFECGKDNSCICWSGRLVPSEMQGYEGSEKVEYGDRIEYVFEFSDNTCVKNVLDTKIRTYSTQKGLRESTSKRDYDGLVIDSDIAKAPTVLPQHDRESAIRITRRAGEIAVNTGLIYEKDILEVMR